MARKSKVDWELYKEQLLQLRAEGKSLTDVNKVLYEKLGVVFSNARLSQKFKEWKQEQTILVREEIERDAMQGAPEGSL